MTREEQMTHRAIQLIPKKLDALTEAVARMASALELSNMIKKGMHV